MIPILSISLAYMQSLYFDGYPYDGPFQHLYPLREMDRGYLPGVDFNFFHGTAIPYINYGIYKLTGGGIFGALFSAKLTQFFSVYLGLLFLCFKLFSKGTYQTAFFIIISIMLTETYFVGLAPLWDVSSFGIRTLTGLIIAGVLVSNVNSRLTSIISLVGLCVLGVLLGTEHGFYCVLSVCIVMLTTSYIHDLWWKRIVYTINFFAVFVISLLILVYILFGSLDSLLFIKNVANDQVWYYGAPPVLFIRSFMDLFNNPHWSYLPKIIIASLFVWVGIIFAAKRKIITEGQFRGLLFLMIWGWIGLTSDLSIVAYHYSEPLLRTILIAVLLIFFVFAENKYKQKISLSEKL